MLCSPPRKALNNAPRHTWWESYKVTFNKRQIYATSPVVRLCLPYMKIHTACIKTITRLLRKKQRKDEGSPLKTSTQDQCATLNSPTPRRSKRWMSIKCPVCLLHISPRWDKGCLQPNAIEKQALLKIPPYMSKHSSRQDQGEWYEDSERP